MANDGQRDAVPGDGRSETETERLDRNWTEILQELRVVQTGTQILTGFLLTLPFQQRFAELNDQQVTVYLFLVSLSAIATILALCPVAIHRALFRMRAKPQIVAIANRVLKAALVAVGLTLTGTTYLIFDIVVNPIAGFVAGGLTAIGCAIAWLAVPVFSHRRHTVGESPALDTDGAKP